MAILAKKYTVAAKEELERRAREIEKKRKAMEEEKDQESLASQITAFNVLLSFAAAINLIDSELAEKYERRIANVMDALKQTPAALHLVEPEITGDEVAWKVGKDKILAIQTCDEGYDYTLFDENYNEIDGGQIDNPDMTMIEVRTVILESFNLEHRELHAMDYEDVMEQAFEVARQAVVVDDPIAEVAFKLDRFSEDFDPYEYRDQVADTATHIQQIQADLRKGNFDPYRTFLENVIMDAAGEKDAVHADALLKVLDRIQFDQDMQKRSVLEHSPKTAGNPAGSPEGFTMAETAQTIERVRREREQAAIKEEQNKNAFRTNDDQLKRTRN